MKLFSFVLLSLVVFTTGCSSTEEIETSRPRTPEGSTSEETPADRQAQLVVTLAQGESALPDDIERLEFRISEVRVHRADGEWVRLPSDMRQFTMSQRQSEPRRTVIETSVPPAEYDSVAFAFNSIFATFNANAGAPLTAPDDAPLRMALKLNPSLEDRTVLALLFEPGASLRRSPDCRWFFVPVIRTETVAP